MGCREEEGWLAIKRLDQRRASCAASSSSAANRKRIPTLCDEPGGQHTQAYVMRNGVYVAETPQPAQPRDPLTAAIRGTTVDFRELKGSAASISFSKKEDSDASFLRHALGKLPQFDGCSPSQVDRIIGAMEPFFLKPRETAIRNGQVIDHLYVLQSGRLQLGGANLQKVLMPGDTFGTEALDSGEPSEYTAFASGMCQFGVCTDGTSSFSRWITEGGCERSSDCG